MNNLRAASLLALAVSGAEPSLAQSGAAVEVTITGVRDSVGTIRVELCPERRWLKPCAITREVPARAGIIVVTFPDVPAGRYGAVAWHDRNRNGKADRNFVGMPTEDVGFSNNALKRLAPPRFADAAFVHDARSQRITFTMKRF